MADNFLRQWQKSALKLSVSCEQGCRNPNHMHGAQIVVRFDMNQTRVNGTLSSSATMREKFPKFLLKTMDRVCVFMYVWNGTLI